VRRAPCKPVGRRVRQIPSVVDREVMQRPRRKPRPMTRHLCRRERPARRPVSPVPQTDTGRLVEETKVDE
jgi:hypothetical protein